MTVVYRDDHDLSAPHDITHYKSVDHGRFLLAIDEVGVIYLVETWVASFGPMPQAMENLVLGIAPRRIDEE